MKVIETNLIALLPKNIIAQFFGIDKSEIVDLSELDLTATIKNRYEYFIQVGSEMKLIECNYNVGFKQTAKSNVTLITADNDKLFYEINEIVISAKLANGIKLLTEKRNELINELKEVLK